MTPPWTREDPDSFIEDVAGRHPFGRRVASVGRPTVGDFVAATLVKLKRRVAAADAGQLIRKVEELVSDEVDDLALPLDGAVDAEHGGAEDGATVLLVQLGRDDPVGDAGLVLK